MLTTEFMRKRNGGKGIPENWPRHGWGGWRPAHRKGPRAGPMAEGSLREIPPPPHTQWAPACPEWYLKGLLFFPAASGFHPPSFHCAAGSSKASWWYHQTHSPKPRSPTLRGQFTGLLAVQLSLRLIFQHLSMFSGVFLFFIFLIFQPPGYLT